MTPSTEKSTRETLTLSEAVAEMVAVPETVAPADGAESETVGTVVSEAEV